MDYDDHPAIRDIRRTKPASDDKATEEIAAELALLNDNPSSRHAELQKIEAWETAAEYRHSGLDENPERISLRQQAQMTNFRRAYESAHNRLLRAGR